MLFSITLTANAGVICSDGTHAFLVDALHDTEGPFWDSMSPDQCRIALEHIRLIRPELILITHRHADHYSPTLTRQAVEESGAGFWGPQLRRDGALYGEFECSTIRVFWRQVDHADSEHFGQENLAYRVELNGHSFLFAGDCTPGDPEIAELAGDAPIDVAILNFNWLHSEQGRRLIREILCPAHLLCVHFLFRDADRAGLAPTTKRIAEDLLPSYDVRIANGFMQKEVIVLPD